MGGLLMLVVVLLYLAAQVSAFSSNFGKMVSRPQALSTLNMLDDRTEKMLSGWIKEHSVILFMKGDRKMPQCGFSSTAVQILDSVGSKYETVNVLADDSIRNGIKEFSSWPTIPQLYVGGEFIGGCDIMIEMYRNGELAEMIEVASNS